jgi:hypothetical protein
VTATDRICMRKQSFALMVVLTLTSCHVKHGHVDVQCQGVGPGINCTVAHKNGRQPVTACWRVNVVCKNGTVVTAEACQRVEPMREESRFIPLADVKNVEKCDVPGRTTVENLGISPSD